MLALVNQPLFTMGTFEARQELLKRQLGTSRKVKGTSDHCDSADLMRLAETLFSSKKHTEKTLGLVIYTGVTTGLRIGDILNMKTENLDPFEGGCRIKLIQGKYKVPFDKLISYRLDDMIGEYLGSKLITNKPDTHIFVNPDTHKPYTIHWVNKRFSILKDDHQWLKDKTFSSHTLRKTYAMTIYKYYGNDVMKARDALGHKSITTTQKYLNLDRKQKELIHANVVKDIFNAVV